MDGLELVLMAPNARKMLASIYKQTGGRTDVRFDRDLEWVEKLEAEEGIPLDDESGLLTQLLDARLLRRGVAQDTFHLTEAGVAAAQGGP
jgi:hypothetical protein